MPVECFWCEPLPLVQRSLRRYHSNDPAMPLPCPLLAGEGSYHNASVVIGDIEKPIVALGEYEHMPSRDEFLTDPRWPTGCGCGTYTFTAADIWQVNDDRYYARSAAPGIAPAPDAEWWVYRCALGLPPGAMMRTWWLEPSFVGPDGMSIGVVLPLPSGMLWAIDFPPSDNADARWSRTGVPPKITVSPSINHVGGGYHGFLQYGILT